MTRTRTRGEPAHGTVTRYNSPHHKCRCTPCTAAVTRVAKIRTLAHARGCPPLIDAGPVREHIEAHRRAGVGLRTLARLADVGHPTLYAIRAGRSKRVERATASAVLGVAVGAEHLAPGAQIPHTAVVRQLRALAWRGWTIRELATRYGADEDALAVLRRAAVGSVTVRTARLVEQMFRELGDVDPPQGSNRFEKAAVSRTRALARRQDWAPAAAWDEDTIGDPAARPLHRLTASQRWKLDNPERAQAHRAGRRDGAA